MGGCSYVKGYAAIWIILQINEPRLKENSLVWHLLKDMKFMFVIGLQTSSNIQYDCCYSSLSITFSCCFPAISPYFLMSIVFRNLLICFLCIFSYGLHDLLQLIIPHHHSLSEELSLILVLNVKSRFHPTTRGGLFPISSQLRL